MANRKRSPRRGARTSSRKARKAPRPHWHDENGKWTDRPAIGLCDYGPCEHNAYRRHVVPLQRSMSKYALCYTHYIRAYRYTTELARGRARKARSLRAVLTPTTLMRAIPNLLRRLSDKEVSRIEMLAKQGKSGVDVTREINERRVAAGQKPVSRATVIRKMPSSKGYRGPYLFGE